jgi:hypothetical protein
MGIRQHVVRFASGTRINCAGFNEKPRAASTRGCCDLGNSDQLEAADGCCSNSTSMIFVTKRCRVLLSC